jgi:hypothetical protein
MQPANKQRLSFRRGAAEAGNPAKQKPTLGLSSADDEMQD